MSIDSLIAAIPDFVAFVRRDGRIVQHVGGRGVCGGVPPEELNGRRLDEVWRGEEAPLLLQWLRKALSTRSQVDGRLRLNERDLAVRISAAGPDRALCVIREEAAEAPAADPRADRPPTGPWTSVDRRGFIARFQQSVADAALRERPLWVGLILLDGLSDIGRSIDYTISDKVATAALQRLPPSPAPDDGGAEGITWYLGQLGEALLAVVIEGSGNRESIGRVAQALSESLAEPVAVGDASFTLTPSIGLAQLGRDAAKPQALLECARGAMMEARRAGSSEVQFYSDTLHLRPMVRLDVERELRDAIAEDELELRYVGRHDLETGRMVAIHAYLRWIAPLRGEVMPAQFLPIAENTGLALPLSQWALKRLQRDWTALREVAGESVRLSFGALRHHLAGDALAQDIETLAAAGAIEPELLELRISEKTLAALASPEGTLGRLADLGATIVIDEFGRGSSSLARFSRLPIRALQIDRSFVVALDEDPAALGVCRSVVGLARGFGFAAHAAGIDDERRRQELMKAGCKEGLGDHFGRLPEFGRSARKMRLTG